MTQAGATRGALDLVCVGGCHRDIVAHTTSAFEPGTSCPGHVRETFGGVARNVAVLAASTGARVALLGRVGVDAPGRALLADLADAGVTPDLTVDDTAATGTYLATHDATGELVAAVSDLSIYDRMTPDVVLDRPVLRAARLLFADANLPEATLLALARRCTDRLAVDAISRAKAPRLAALLPLGPIVFVNLTSAETLLGRSFTDAAEAAASLADRGARAAVVTAGSAPVAVLDDGAVHRITVPRRTVVDVTGAGDALTAATLAARLRGHTLAEAVGFGIKASGAALACSGALDRLPAGLVAELNATGTLP